MPLIIIIGILAIIIINLSSRHRERMEMIRRGINPDLKQAPATNSKGNRILLAGLFGGFFGLALSVSAVLVHRRFDPDMLTAGLLFLFGGISFVIYWKLTKNQRDNKIQEDRDLSFNTDKSTGNDTCDNSETLNIK